MEIYHVFDIIRLSKASKTNSAVANIFVSNYICAIDAVSFYNMHGLTSRNTHFGNDFRSVALCRILLVKSVLYICHPTLKTAS